VKVLSVKFKSGLSDDEVMRVIHERAPSFRALPGLIQKYYAIEKETGELSGIYIWDSEESLRQYRESELARTIAKAYQAVGTPRIEVFDVPLVLRS
jgi:hypothetical protein